MKKIITLTVSLSLSLSLIKADYWTQKASFPGGGLVFDFAFATDNKGYVGCGGNWTLAQDFWEYDPATNVWTQKANFSGLGRDNAFAFSIAGKGYVGTGDGLPGPMDDFWEYDPLTNAWTQKADFGGGLRSLATAFAIGNMGYAGTGANDINDYHDLWQYNPLTNAWTQKAFIPGFSIFYSQSFAIGNYGYIAGGFTGSFSDDLWEYNSITDSWVQKNNLPFARENAVTFTICGKGYFGTGYQGGPNWCVNEFWEWNQATDTWTQKANYMGLGLFENIGFSIGTKGYIGLGFDANFSENNDFWEYTPDSTCATGLDDASAPLSMTFNVSPNPVKELLVISYSLPGKEKINLTITDISGKKVYQTKLFRKKSFGLTSDLRLPTFDFQKGIYFVELNNGKEKVVKKFLKE